MPKKAPQLSVAAFATALGLAVGQEKVAHKRNEITAIPVFLNALHLQGYLVNIDAMGCQKEIARTIRDQQADYLLAVKGNQGDLEASFQTFFDAARCAQLQTTGAHLETLEKDHGRIETRRYWVADNVFGLVDGKVWQDCRTVGMVELVRETGKKEAKVGRRYFHQIGCAGGEAFRGGAGSLAYRECAAGTHRKAVHNELTDCEQAAREMEAGPPKSAFRSGLQTTPSCCGKEPWW